MTQSKLEKPQNESNEGIHKIRPSIINVADILKNDNFWNAVSVANQASKFGSKKSLPQINYADVAKTPQDFIAAFNLRSRVYSQMGYGKEFAAADSGLDFDKYDPYSVTFLYKTREGVPFATSRFIIDNNEVGLMTEKYCDINHYRKKGKIMEASRMIILPEFQKRTNTLFNNVALALNFGQKNGITQIVCAVVNSHVGMYLALGGVEVIKKNIECGLEEKISILNWDMSRVKESILKRCSRKMN